MSLDKAFSIAAKAFEGVFDKHGQPYFVHCYEVMRRVNDRDEDVRCAAVLHDLVEDTEWTLEQLLSEGFSERCVQLVSLVTHDKQESYEEYVLRLSSDPDARAIKMSDLCHNSDITRCKGVSSKDMERIQKYHRAYMTLRMVDLEE